ncbi:unnamed protein product [Bursaphelenchus okinawaensis]|uniref:Protection of telomeres protein 1 n=1 Tax=Bursaphelenchus okinawaensis TaxID=465554 RepID=A0A811LNS1_9BILA|nr:unnamed protein product [Bursaphelenchus okinawaensis]CAG9125034.1 unnamed protein product [Bursaphelenchus okinawaensis]
MVLLCLQNSVIDEFVTCSEIRSGLVQNLVCVVQKVDKVYIDKSKTLIKIVIHVIDDTNPFQPIKCSIWTPWRSISGELDCGTVVHLRHFEVERMNDHLELKGYCGLQNVSVYGFNNYGKDIDYTFWACKPDNDKDVYTVHFMDKLSKMRKLVSAVFGEMMRIHPDIETPRKVTSEEFDSIFQDEGLEFGNSPFGEDTSFTEPSPSTSQNHDEPGMKIFLDWEQEKSDPSKLNLQSLCVSLRKIRSKLGGRVPAAVDRDPFELLKPTIKKGIEVKKLDICEPGGECCINAQIIGYEFLVNGDAVLRVWDGSRPILPRSDISYPFSMNIDTFDKKLNTKAPNYYIDIYVDKSHKDVLEMFKPGEYAVFRHLKTVPYDHLAHCRLDCDGVIMWIQSHNRLFDVLKMQLHNAFPYD